MTESKTSEVNKNVIQFDQIKENTALIKDAKPMEPSLVEKTTNKSQ